MPIVVKPINKEFKVVVGKGKNKIEFFLKQLPYSIKSEITSLTTKVEQGQFMQDSGMVCFYNIMHGLKRVSGLHNVDGTMYKLKFEDREKSKLTEECTEELLATSFSDEIIFIARELSEAVYPTKILHPLTKVPLKDIEVVPASKLKATTKK